MRIPVEVTGVDQAVSELDRVAAAGQRASNAGRGIDTPSAPARSRASSGPLSRFMSAQADFETNPYDFDTRVRFSRAQNALSRAERQLEPPSAMDRFMDVLGTSRVTMGPVSPLINRVAGLAGEGASGAAIGGTLLAGGALLAVSQFAKELNQTTQQVREFGRAASLTGGHAETVRLSAFGLDPSRIASGSAGLRQRISLDGGDPFAQSAAMRLGISLPLGTNFGPQNNARFYEQALQALHDLGEGEEQLRLARQLGLDAELDLVNVSERTWQQLKREAAERERIFSPAVIQQGREYEAQIRRVTEAWENAKGRMWAAVAPLATKAAENTADFVEDTSKNPWNILPIFAIPKAFQDARDEVFGKKDEPKQAQADAKAQAQEDNTRALMDLSRVMRQMVGGGPRAGAGWPAGLRGSAPMQEAAARGALTAGAWKL